ncbi:hypothetical protein MACH16_02740 [Marinomonas pontica]|uniref:Lipoprotein n=1 Tax=Marinomonas pontica TaxID=264739 RepID=A0ABM8F976_9GAMM|nr:hypothetical protein MACH16_02740 [Marinomonas pontica]
MNKSKLLITMLLGASLAACASTATETSMAAKYDIDGFKTQIEDGRLWVFEDGSEELAFFKKHGEPAKQFTNIGAGPEGMTVKAASQESLDKYLAAISGGSEFDIKGFKTKIEDGRLWVFEEGSEDLAFFEKHGEPAKQFTSIGTGPNGMTVKAASQETLDKYLSTYKK